MTAVPVAVATYEKTGSGLSDANATTMVAVMASLLPSRLSFVKRREVTFTREDVSAVAGPVPSFTRRAPPERSKTVGESEAEPTSTESTPVALSKDEAPTFSFVACRTVRMTRWRPKRMFCSTSAMTAALERVRMTSSAKTVIAETTIEMRAKYRMNSSRVKPFGVRISAVREREVVERRRERGVRGAEDGAELGVAAGRSREGAAVADRDLGAEDAPGAVRHGRVPRAHGHGEAGSRGYGGRPGDGDRRRGGAVHVDDRREELAVREVRRDG